MFDRADVIYHYDGSFEGLLCCVFTSFQRKETPLEIVPEIAAAPSFFPVRVVATDRARAARVCAGLKDRIAFHAQGLVQTAYLCASPDREMQILLFLQRGFDIGYPVLSRLADPAVAPFLKSVRAVEREAMHYCGFVRFRDCGGALGAVIEPQGRVLPLLAAHFVGRYNSEQFFIYDKTHGEGLYANKGRAEMVSAERFDLAEDRSETDYEALWKVFHRAVSIGERRNPRCQQTHMPKRYWKYLPELASAPLP